jgi:Ribosomal protein S9
LELQGAYDVVARIDGGGIAGQAGALRLGISRALNQIDADNNRPTLKKAGFLSRDSRVIESKKAGLKKGSQGPPSSPSVKLPPWPGFLAPMAFAAQRTKTSPLTFRCAWLSGPRLSWQLGPESVENARGR